MWTALTSETCATASGRILIESGVWPRGASGRSKRCARKHRRRRPRTCEPRVFRRLQSRIHGLTRPQRAASASSRSCAGRRPGGRAHSQALPPVPPHAVEARKCPRGWGTSSPSAPAVSRPPAYRAETLWVCQQSPPLWLALRRLSFWGSSSLASVAGAALGSRAKARTEDRGSTPASRPFA